MRLGHLFVPQGHHRRGRRRLVRIQGAPPAAAWARAIHGLGAALIGEDPRAIGRHRRGALRPVRAPSRAGSIGNAVGAILNACLDIKGKALGVPVYELFGGAVRDRIPVYWSRCGVIRRALRRLCSTARWSTGRRCARSTISRRAAREARERGFKAAQDQPAGVRREGRPAIRARLGTARAPAIPSSTCRTTCSTR